MKMRKGFLSLRISFFRSSKTGSYLVAGYNLASFVGRILFGFLADSRVGPLTSLCLAMLLMAFSILSIWIASSGLLAPLILFLLVNGSAAGALLSLQPPTLAALYGLTEMASTMSMVTMSRAAVSIAISCYRPRCSLILNFLIQGISSRSTFSWYPT